MTLAERLAPKGVVRGVGGMTIGGRDVSVSLVNATYYRQKACQKYAKSDSEVTQK